MPERLSEGSTVNVLSELELEGDEDIWIQLLKLSEDNWKDPEQVVLSVLVFTVVVSIDSENVIDIDVLSEIEVSISDGLTRLNKLKPYKFNWKKFPDRDKEDGFFAHEVEGIVPQAISGEKDAVDEDGEMIIQSMDKSSLVPLLVAAVQELSEKNEALEKRIEKLEK